MCDMDKMESKVGISSVKIIVLKMIIEVVVECEICSGFYMYMNDLCMPLELSKMSWRDLAKTKYCKSGDNDAVHFKQLLKIELFVKDVFARCDRNGMKIGWCNKKGEIIDVMNKHMSMDIVMGDFAISRLIEIYKKCKNTKYVGVYYPLTNDIQIYRPIVPEVDIFRFLGTHVRKGKIISSTLKNYASLCMEKYGKSLPCQMMIRSINGKCTIKESEIQESLKYIKKYKIPYYTHSVYTINLCNPYTKKNLKSDEWVLDLLRNDLKITSQMGGRGVVVHVGKKLKMDVEDALDKMEQSIRKVLQYASPECPLLIETPAGQGTETCTKIEDFSEFYKRFEDDPRIRICIDTCHVFASGYDPYYYITEWNKLHPNTISLIHFNDSKKPINSHVDRHAYPGKGHIGIKKMEQVAYFCIKNKIDMVME